MIDDLIRSRSNLAQVINFSGLKFGSMYPSDIDAIIEVRDKLWIVIEVKHGDAEPPFGQRLMLERLVDALSEHRQAILFLANHKSRGEVDLASCIVTKYRIRKKWVVPRAPVTVHDAVKKMIREAE